MAGWLARQVLLLPAQSWTQCIYFLLLPPYSTLFSLPGSHRCPFLLQAVLAQELRWQQGSAAGGTGAPDSSAASAKQAYLTVQATVAMLQLQQVGGWVFVNVGVCESGPCWAGMPAGLPHHISTTPHWSPLWFRYCGVVAPPSVPPPPLPQVLSEGDIPLGPPVPSFGEAEVRQGEVREQAPIGLASSQSLSCTVCFSRGQEQEAVFAVEGLPAHVKAGASPGGWVGGWVGGCGLPLPPAVCLDCCPFVRLAGSLGASLYIASRASCSHPLTL